ncbi:MAG: sialate O-acetylesterase [Verrucomicrobiales bacterium]|nr:sialate O-acetylesterase [Verrucomicrobiales bacterium]
MNKIIITLLLILTSSIYAFSDEHYFQLAVPFTDNMILQRDAKVPVWGQDITGSEITVKFSGQTKKAIADKQGDWMVKLDPLKASLNEQLMEVSNDKGKSITLKGVLVGEVWFSSGQSNMVWIAGKSMCNELAKEIASSKEELPIREININTVSALYPQKKGTSDGGWKKSSLASGFSALSLSFAYDLYKELKIPIGILLSAHSNTRIEAFTQRRAIVEHPKLKGDADLILNADPLLKQGQKAFEDYYADLKSWQKEAGKLSELGGKVPARPNLPGISGMWRGPSQFFNGKISPVIPYGIRGAIWCQGTSNSGDGRIYAARMEALINGWRDAWEMPEMPFYFTQMQPYGSPDSNSVGFAAIRQVQHVFFVNNRKNVGMVIQSDINSANPGGIHYYNKLHPGMRMARRALNKQYKKDIPYTGPIYKDYKIEGNKVLVSFEKNSLFGGLMVGSKGLAKDRKEPGKFVEPALATPKDKLNHFRLCGQDKKWYQAEAKIVGDRVEVISPDVSIPIGVQYAYSAVPEQSNLYNKAGLPATPFALINKKFIFEEDDLKKAAALKAKYARWTDPDYPILQVAEYYRDGVILQRNQPIRVWGHANKGVQLTVSLDGVIKKVKANELDQWSVSFPSREASIEPITLKVESGHGFERIVSDILIGDVWYLTGSTLLTSEWPYNLRDKEAILPKAMPIVREFCRKTKASSFPTPRKRRFETGSGKYRSHWLTADYAKENSGVTAFAYEFAKTLNRPGIPQGFITMSSGSGGRNGQFSSPLSWTSYKGVKSIKNLEFKTRLDELFLQFPGSDIAMSALSKHIKEVKDFTQIISNGLEINADYSKFPLQAPSFPEAGKSESVRSDTIPTYTYNWCVSPLTPMAVSGVIWVPSESNIGEDPSEYAAELEIYAKSLPETYGQQEVQFLYAHPKNGLVENIKLSKIDGAKVTYFDQWPKSIKTIAVELAEQIK